MKTMNSEPPDIHCARMSAYPHPRLAPRSFLFISLLLLNLSLGLTDPSSFDPSLPVKEPAEHDGRTRPRPSWSAGQGLGPPRDRLSEAVHIHDVSMVQGLINAFMDGVEIMGVPTMSLGRR